MSPFRYKRVFPFIRLGYNGSSLYICRPVEYSVGIDENVFCFSFATLITKKMIEICGIRIIGLMWHK